MTDRLSHRRYPRYVAGGVPAFSRRRDDARRPDPVQPGPPRWLTVLGLLVVAWSVAFLMLFLAS